ncbi:MAG TPA: peptidoglycan recognition family protein, partial [Acidimicrobiales bacterium]|nr:peptidoglycan recognition family protein [Acidimicrobiales bacterium]
MVEPTPRAQIGPEPEYLEETSPSTRRNSAKPTSPPPPPSPGTGPAIEGPKTDSSGTPTTWNADGTAGAGKAPAGSAARLEPFIAGASATELFYPEKADRPWRYIVLHHSASAAGNYDEIDREHRKLLGYDGCGYHFVIGNGNGSGDGQIEIAQRWNGQKQGVHCRNARSHDVDEYGIGICLVGDLDQQPPTPRQIAATRALVDYLSRRYRIDPSHITTHAHLAATPTVCPGKFFPAVEVGARGEGRGT